MSSQLGVYSKDGKGRFFDELVLTTQGLGKDPYQFASLRVRKNRLFEYNLTWRLNTCFNPALTISEGRHLLDTPGAGRTTTSSSDPRRGKGILGYSRNRQDGPGLSTVNVFGRSGDEFPTLLDIRRERNEYRFGGAIDLRRFRLRVVRIRENFKEDTPERPPGPSVGNNPDNGVALDSFERIQPYPGNSPGWRGQVYAEPNTRLSINAHGTYAGGGRNFIVDETAAGTNRFDRAFNRQGSSRLPRGFVTTRMRRRCRRIALDRGTTRSTSPGRPMRGLLLTRATRRFIWIRLPGSADVPAGLRVPSRPPEP